MFGFLWEMRPYFRQVVGQLVLGSVAGIIMNTAVVLPAILLGRAIDRALSWERGAATAGDVGWAALAFVGGTLLTEVPRIGKRWWLMTANARIRANVRADAFRGVLAWPMADLQRTSIGDLMARIVGDVEVLGVGVREFTIETWDTVLFSLSFVVALLVFDPGLTVLALLPAPLAMVLAHATGRWVARRTTSSREANADLTSAIQEHLSGIRVLRLFGRASASVERVAELSRRVAERNLGLTRLKGGLQPIYTTLMIAGVLLIVWQGSERVVAGVMTVGAFVAYLELFLRFVNRGHRICRVRQEHARTVTAGNLSARIGNGAHRWPSPHEAHARGTGRAHRLPAAGRAPVFRLSARKPHARPRGRASRRSISAGCGEIGGAGGGHARISGRPGHGNWRARGAPLRWPAPAGRIGARDRRSGTPLSRTAGLG